MTRTIFEYTLTTVFMLGFVLMIVFAMINFMLGCETWDQSYWTEMNSCVTPTDFFGMLTGWMK
jgi:hypothetical protein